MRDGRRALSDGRLLKSYGEEAGGCRAKAGGNRVGLIDLGSRVGLQLHATQTRQPRYLLSALGLRPGTDIAYAATIICAHCGTSFA
eukprot:2346471-Rhodomonas_salina.2